VLRDLVGVVGGARFGAAEGRAMTVTDEEVVASTTSWVNDFVIGLNLCPFAKAVQAKGQVRYVVSHAKSGVRLLEELQRELSTLQAADPSEVDTTLLIHPHVLGDFFDYNDFLAEVDDLLQELELEGELQVASFHPEYCFADSAPDDSANYTNRSPYPMLHLLREASVTRAVDTYPDTAAIPDRNVELLRTMPAEELKRRLRGSKWPPG
jgi:hypothetical protein